MTNDKYAKAYTEVLEILRYLPRNEYNKIAIERIKFFEANKDTSYKFKIDPAMPLDKQNISIEANSIIIVLFRDYFATENQKEKLNVILKQNEYKYQEDIRNKYNPDNIFKDRKNKNLNVIENTNLPIEVKENNFFTKFITYIKNLFRKMKKEE
mgnify:FL=1